jgi:hypothetical protein
MKIIKVVIISIKTGEQHVYKMILFENLRLADYFFAIVVILLFPECYLTMWYFTKKQDMGTLIYNDEIKKNVSALNVQLSRCSLIENICVSFKKSFIKKI